MLVHVEADGCETLVLPVPLDGLIGDLRQAVADALDVKPYLLTVHWDGSPVDDDAGVGELGICDGDVLQCAKVRIPSGVVASVEKPEGVRAVLFTACEEYFLLVFERAWERRALDGTVMAASVTLEQPVCQAAVAGAYLLLSHPDNTVAVHCCADARVVCVLDTFLPPSFYVGSGGRADPNLDASALSLRFASHVDGRFVSCLLQGDALGAACVFDLEDAVSPRMPRAEPAFRRGAAQDGGAAYSALAVGMRGGGELLLALGTEKQGCPEVVLLSLDAHGSGGGGGGGGKAASPDPLLRLAGNRGSLLNVAFSNGAKTVFGASEHDIAVWETTEGVMLMRMRCSQAMQWYTLTVSASNEQLFSVNDLFCSVFKLNENSCIYAGQVSSICRDESVALCVAARQLYRVRELGEGQGKRVELHTYNAVSTDPFEHFCDLADYAPTASVQCLPSASGHKCLVLRSDRIDVLQ